MTQAERLVSLFREHKGEVRLHHIMDAGIGYEWRARATELRRRGFQIDLIEKHPEKPSLNKYRLVEPMMFDGAQAVFL